MSKTIKIGIISAGQISKNHAEGYKKAGAEVVAICDPVEAARTTRAKEYSIPNAYETAEELIKKHPEIDAVSVCSPNSFHAKFVIMALEAGKHVMTEKPMAMNVEEAEAMVAAAKKAKKILMCGHNQRFTPEAQKVNDLREDGTLGKVYHAKCAWIRRRGIPGLGRWFTTKALSGGGPLIDIGIHVIDRTWYMMGKPKPIAVSGMTYNVFGKDIKKYVCTGMWAGPRDPKGIMDVEDFASAFVRFDNGASMTIEVSWAANRVDENSWSLIMGDKNGALVNNDGISLYGERGSALATEKIDFDKSEYKDRHGHFIDCVQNGVTCTCPGEDGLAIQKVLNGIYQSSEKNAEVKI
ncbi:MAG: Gfo/Idh/MocA family oxidoreductase [Spirochaetota bacterium]